MTRRRTLATVKENPRDARAVSQMLAEMSALHVLGVKGRVEIEIIDDRTGRVVDRQESPNYVNTAEWEASAKAIQKQLWTFGYAGDPTTVTVSPTNGLDPRYLPPFRADYLGCWTDTTAEDSADIFATGEIIAWAHRWAQGSPSTRQGVVQPSLCTLAEDAISWVWEWATPNGNGTFQSVGWRRFGQSANSGDAILRDLPTVSAKLSATTGYVADAGLNVSSQMSFTSGAQDRYGCPIYYDSGSGELYSIVYISGNLWKLYSCPVTLDSFGDYTLGTTVDRSAAAFAAGLNGNSLAVATRTTNGITRLGSSGDWIAVGYSGAAGSTARRPTICRVTNAGSTIYTNANGGTYSVESVFKDVTYDGSDLWVTAQNGNTGAPAIHRIDPATGTISATISTIASVPAYFPQISASRGVSGIEWDADQGWLWITTTDDYCFNIDTSGNWGGVLLTHTTNNTATLSGQHSGTAAALGFGRFDPIMLTYTPSGGSPSSTSNPYHQGDLQDDTPAAQLTAATLNPGFNMTRLTTMNGKVWYNIGNAAASWTTGTPSTIGKWVLWEFSRRRTFLTRTLLGSPATKNSTQTMRIRYTMTFT
jgi:hypothetical protein